jgi:hypothetical protein
MSSKMGMRETGRKPVTTRRHDSLTDGAFGREGPENIRSGEELNRKLSGQPSKQHSKYTKEESMATAAKTKSSPVTKGKKSLGETRGQSERDPKGRKGQFTAAGDSAQTRK